MATLQNTTVPDNGYYRVGTSTNKAFVSAGTYFGAPLAHFGYDAWYSLTGGWTGTGPFIQLYNNGLSFVTSASTFVTPFSVSASTTTLASTTTTVVKTTTVGVYTNSSINSTLGVGATAGVTANDGKILVNAGGTSKPFLEVTNCLGNGSTTTATYSVFKGYLRINIGANVGPSTSTIVSGQHYIRLWGT